MKFLIAIIMGLLMQQAYAGCESTIAQGSHSAPTLAEAKAGAWEDVKDVCYPGRATALDVQCDLVTGELGIQGQPAHRCRQSATCTLCDQNLQRKYEALEQ